MPSCALRVWKNTVVGLCSVQLGECSTDFTDAGSTDGSPLAGSLHSVAEPADHELCAAAKASSLTTRRLLDVLCCLKGGTGILPGLEALACKKQKGQQHNSVAGLCCECRRRSCSTDRFKEFHFLQQPNIGSSAPLTSTKVLVTLLPLVFSSTVPPASLQVSKSLVVTILAMYIFVSV